MKRLSLVVCTLFVLNSLSATTYYSINGTAPNDKNNWRTNRNGTGSSPANFNNNGDIFIIQTNHTVTTTGNWTIGGTNSRLTMESNSTLRAYDKVSVDVFQMDAGSNYYHRVDNATFPGSNTRTLSSTSTVTINDWGGGGTELPSPTTWGNLVIDLSWSSYNSNWNQTGHLTNIAGDFIIISTGINSKQLRLTNDEDYTLTIGGDLDIRGGIVEAARTDEDNADQYIVINGSYTQSGGTFQSSNDESNLIIQFNGAASTFEKTGGTLDNAYMNWVINSTKKLTLISDLPVALSRSLTVNGSLDCGNSKKITGLGLFTLASTGTFITSNTSGIAGSLNLTQILISLNNGSSYQIDGATTTPFPFWLLSVSCKNLTIGANVTLNKNVSVSGTMTLSAGKLTIPTGFTATITSGNAIAGSGFDNTKHIVTQVNTSTGAKGFIRLGGFTGTRTIPVGNGTYYMPVTLSASGTNDFSINVFQGATKNGEPNGTAYNAASKLNMVDAIWVVNRNAGSSAVNMQLIWPAALEGNTFKNYPDNEIGISHYGPTYWDQAMGSGSQAANNVTRSAILSFSPFAIAKQGIPLPMKFADVRAFQQSNGVQVDWTALAEIDVHHYEIDRSTDGRQFNNIAQIAARANSGGKVEYSSKDITALSGTFFYRIKSVDLNGKFIYSNIVKITISTNNAAPSLEVYPNPVIDRHITFQGINVAKGMYKLNVYDQSGRVVYTKGIEHTGGAVTQIIELPSTLQKGLYNIQLMGEAIKLSKPFMIQ